MVKRGILLALLCSLSYCAPANAGGHAGYQGWGEDDISWEELDTKRDDYTVPPMPKLRDAGGHNYSITVVNREPDYYADVVIQNQLVSGVYTASTVRFHRPDGLVITVVAVQEDGATPDYFYVIPPKGHCAFPVDIVLGEEEAGTIEIHPCTIG